MRTTALSATRDVWPAIVLAALAIPVIVVGLGSYSVVNGDEALYHGIAEEMVASGVSAEQRRATDDEDQEDCEGRRLKQH